jgi:hypothetical protein
VGDGDSWIGFLAAEGVGMGEEGAAWILSGSMHTDELQLSNVVSSVVTSATSGRACLSEMLAAFFLVLGFLSCAPLGLPSLDGYLWILSRFVSISSVKKI